MTDETSSEWFYVVVQNPDTNEEQLMGYKDNETGASFIPAFRTKEEAQQCFLLMPKDIINKKYEVQALMKEDLVIQAGKKGYAVFLLNEQGQILEKLEN